MSDLALSSSSLADTPIDALGVLARQQCDSVESHLSSALHSALAAGRTLAAAKIHFADNKQWTAWVHSLDLRCGYQGALNYVRLAHYEPEILAAVASGDHMTPSSALKFLTGRPAWDGRSGGRKPGPLSATARRAKEARKALRRQEAAEMARRAGGTAASAYSSIRKAAAALDTCLAEASSKDEREALSEALRAVYKAEDSIVRALRLGRRGQR